MNITVKTFFKTLDDYAKQVDDFTGAKDFNETILNDLLNEFDAISAFLITSSKVPEKVKDFISAETFDENFELPEEYSKLKSVFKLRKHVTGICNKNIAKYLKDKDYAEVLKYMSIAVKVDIKNVVILEQLADVYKQEELQTNLIDLYRVMFVYTMNPEYFEKIGDVFFEQEKYSEAIDSYLSCAETADDNVRIFEKLAEAFGRVNDNDSRLACLEQIKRIGGDNA